LASSDGQGLDGLQASLADVSLGWPDLIRGKPDFLLDNIGQSISVTPHFSRAKKTASILAGGETVPFRQHLVSDFLNRRSGQGPGGSPDNQRQRLLPEVFRRSKADHPRGAVRVKSRPLFHGNEGVNASPKGGNDAFHLTSFPWLNYTFNI